MTLPAYATRLGAQVALQRCLVLRAGDFHYTTRFAGKGDYRQVGASVVTGYNIPRLFNKNRRRL